MIELVFGTMATALLAAFLVTLLTKWGVVEYMQTHGTRLISALANCDFCKCWWGACLAALLLAAIAGHGWLLLTPPLAVPIARLLL